MEPKNVTNEGQTMDPATEAVMDDAIARALSSTEEAADRLPPTEGSARETTLKQVMQSLLPRIIDALLPDSIFGYGLFLVDKEGVEFASNGSLTRQAEVLRGLADAAEAKLRAKADEAAASAEPTP